MTTSIIVLLVLLATILGYIIGGILATLYNHASGAEPFLKKELAEFDEVTDSLRRLQDRVWKDIQEKDMQEKN